MSVVLLIDDAAICREPIAATLEARGMTVLCASDGAESLARLNEHRPDVIVLEMGLPDMDGIILLRTLRADPAWNTIPVVVLTSITTKPMVVAAAELGVKDYILKSQFSLADLLKRLDRYVAPSPAAASTEGAVAESRPDAPPVLTRAKTLGRLKAYRQIKALPGIVAEVVALASSSRCDTADLVTLLKREPMLAVRVLHMANSAAFTTRKARIATIEEAVRNIGISSVRNIATTLGLVDAFSDGAFKDIGLIRCWQHSLAVATLMDLFPKDPEDSPGITYLVGLCHDLAEVVLRQCLPVEYAAILGQQRTSGVSLARVEEAALGISRAEVSTLVLERLGLPAPISRPISEYWRREVGEPGRWSPLALQLRMANSYANGMLLCGTQIAEIFPVTAAECAIAFGKAEPPDVNPESIRSDVLLTTSLLAQLPSATFEEVSKPLLPRVPIDVAYFPHTTLSNFDPLYAALRMLCKVTLFNEFPACPDALNGATLAIITLPPDRDSSTRVREIATRWKSNMGSDLQVLCLTDVEEAPDLAAFFTLARYPVTPKTLAAFIAQGDGSRV
jgi:CheY-like chemotaxis protein/HD-like signal output (HDOD) protein